VSNPELLLRAMIRLPVLLGVSFCSRTKCRILSTDQICGLHNLFFFFFFWI
jgi:hypothetical protein